MNDHCRRGQLKVIEEKIFFWKVCWVDEVETTLNTVQILTNALKILTLDEMKM